MMTLLKKSLFAIAGAVAAGMGFVGVAEAASIGVTFDKLTGLTGGTPAGTAVYRADLSNLGFNLNSIQILDNSSGLGGAPGQFTGFDLDAVVLSPTLITSATNVGSLVSLGVFNFSPAGTIFTPGSQRSPVDPALFGTSGGSINNSVATLGVFDGNSTTAIPGAHGFVSLGDNGKVGFNLTSPISTTSPLYLYIGEVGDNGEVAAGTISVSDKPLEAVPEPSSIMGMALMGLGASALRKRKGMATR